MIIDLVRTQISKAVSIQKLVITNTGKIKLNNKSNSDVEPQQLHSNLRHLKILAQPKVSILVSMSTV